MDVKEMYKKIVTTLFAGGSLLVVPGSCCPPPVDMGIDAVGLPQKRDEQLKLKSKIKSSIKNTPENNILWSGNADDDLGLQEAIETSIGRRQPMNPRK